MARPPRRRPKPDSLAEIEPAVGDDLADRAEPLKDRGPLPAVGSEADRSMVGIEEGGRPHPRPAGNVSPVQKRTGRASSRRRQRAALVVALVSGFGLLGAVAWGLHFVVTYPDRPVGTLRKPVQVEITRGASLSDVADLLHAKGIVSRPAFFRLYVTQRGGSSKIRHGRYHLSGSMTASQLLAALMAGPVVRLVKVTIPEGKNILDVAHILAGAGFGSYEELARLVRDRHFAHRLGVPGDTLEGYLFPDTYKFREHASAKEVLAFMVRRHRKIMRQLEKQYPNGVIRLRHSLRFTDREIVIMASIVEKETANPAERPVIASVYLNRLLFASFRPKRLEADPTIVYGCTVPLHKSAACQKFEGKIRYIHLRDPDNSYNTYQHEGLPPGPICNPGRAALAAVLHHARTKYLFFVSKNNGSHYFSATRQEHERAVWLYQKQHRARPRPGAPR
ncbi:MAG: endolytic transglycosylase MltG [Deltaproteobacteria bacterium]|nr:endolytic transglycosylase MltG [Deltaproteobacteria bacterium]